MPVDSMKEMERTPYSSPESLRVRCPHCRKLYLVQYADIQEAKPRFECVQCHQRFWLSLQDMDLSGELIGLTIETKQPPRSEAKKVPQAGRDLEPCPKCFKLNEPSAAECGHCGVVIGKLKNAFHIQDSFPPHSMALEVLWHRVLADFGNEKLHDEFFVASQKENNLAYAAALYKQMVKLMPADDMSQRRLMAIEKLGESLLPPRAAVMPRPKRGLPRVWQVPLAAGVMLIVVGMSSPVFRNMAGVGAAFLFFAVMLQLQLRRR